MKSIAKEHRYFEIPKDLRPLLACSPAGALFEAAVCAGGLLLVQALQPADFVTTAGHGDEAQDIYEVSAAAGLGQPRSRLRIGLMPYRFAGQPPLLMITIEAVADAGQPKARAT